MELLLSDSLFFLFKNNRDKKVALHDKAQGYLVCVPLAGIEPATLPIVGGMLYPMSYSGTQFGI